MNTTSTTTTTTTSTTTSRIPIQCWGPLCHRDSWSEPAYAVRRDTDRDIDAVSRALARANRLEVCAGPRLDCTTTTSTIYQITLGRPLRTGGWSPAGQIWIAIDR